LLLIIQTREKQEFSEQLAISMANAEKETELLNSQIQTLVRTLSLILLLTV